MAYDTDPYNHETNRRLEKMGKEGDRAGSNFIFGWFIAGIILVFIFLKAMQ